MMPRPILTCQDCSWRGEFSPAVDHYRGTRHQLLFHGHPQDLKNFVGCCQRCGTDLLISPSWGAANGAGRIS